MGSVLCGSVELIQRARRWRKMAGGGMRQSGILAAAIEYALDNNVERLKVDHDNARQLADALAEIDGIKLRSNQTNMVFIELADQETGTKLADYLAEHDVTIIGGRNLRLVTHLGIDSDDIDKVVALVRAFF